MQYRYLLAIASLAAGSPAHAGYIDHYATGNDVGLDKAPAHGTSHIIVLPVVVQEAGLPGEAALISSAQSFYDNTAAGFTFRNYFRTASLGRFDPLTTIAPTIFFASCPFQRDGDGNCTIPRGDLTTLGPAMVAIRDILDTADADVNFLDYDVNGAVANTPDGYVDGVLLLTNIEFGGIALPHYRICEQTPINFLYCFGGGSLWDPTYDNVVVPWVAVSGASGGDTDVATYVSVHEFGHLLGFADLYDENGGSTNQPYAVMGGWGYNNQPQLPSAFSRYVIGWGNPVQAAGDGSVILRPAHSFGDLLKLGSGSEYFLVENRRPRGPWDADITAPGVVILHVNLAKRPDAGTTSFLTTIVNCVNCDDWSPMLMVEQADGQFELQQGWDNRDDAGDIFHTGDSLPSAPTGAPLSSSNATLNSNLYDGSTTGISLTVTDDSAAGGNAIVQIVHPAVGDACADLLCPPGITCVDGVCDSGNEEPVLTDGGPVDDGAHPADGAPPVGDSATGGDPAYVAGDSGTPVGQPKGVDDGGCACSGSTPMSLALLMPLAVLRRRRRR